MLASKIKLTQKNQLQLRFVCVRDTPKTVVIALGGNALLRDGQACTQEVQAENIKIAAKQIAKIAVQRESYNIILTHGNGPQVCSIRL
jgi:carbamate kinase